MRDGAEAVKAIVAQADDFRAEPPRPLIRELLPADPFPVDALGNVLGAATRAIDDRVQAPIAICGQSTLAAATLAAQGHADVELPTGQVKPISNFFVSVAATGERKTATDNEALMAVPEARNGFARKVRPGPAGLRERQDRLGKSAGSCRKESKGRSRGDQVRAGSLGPAPTAPLAPMLTCPEPTYEGLCKHLVVRSAEYRHFLRRGRTVHRWSWDDAGGDAANRSRSFVPVGRGDDKARSGGTARPYCPVGGWHCI